MSKGRKILLSVILVTIFLSLYSIALNNFTKGTGNLPQQMIRLVLTLILTFFLYKEYKIARIVSIALYSIAGVLGLLTSIVILTKTVTGIMIFFPSVVYLICAGVLLFNSEVKNLFEKSEE